MSTASPVWPTSIDAAQAADWPRLAGARGSLRHALALRAAFGELADRWLSQPDFEIGIVAACTVLCCCCCADQVNVTSKRPLNVTD